MPRLVVSEREKPIGVFSFSDEISIGRHESNDVILSHKEVSGCHAFVREDKDGRYGLSDNASLNGTRVRGERITFFPLSDGTIFEIADYTLKFTEDTGSAADKKPLVHLSKGLALDKRFERDAKTVFSLAAAVEQNKEEYRDPQHRLSLVLQLTQEIIAGHDDHDVIEKALSVLMGAMEAERGFVALRDEDGHLLYYAQQGFKGDLSELEVSDTMIQAVVGDGRSIITSDALAEPEFQEAKSVTAYQIKSVMCVPLRLDDEILGCIYLDHPEKTGSFGPEDLDFLTILSFQIALAIENARLHHRIQEEREALKSRLRIREKIITFSAEMTRLYEQVQKVAGSKISVLIMGETGSGKELVASAVHRWSERTGRFLAVNCAAIPDKLLESELFGYEKGAFTSAERAKPGFFELAHRGTIFLDEIGEMSPQLQGKLLRVLEGGRITRLGGTVSKEVDTRVVSATNRDLSEMVKASAFREDLFWRLCSVELTVPPLRKRKKDIRPLANYLLGKFAEEERRKPPDISRKAMDLLLAYDWPGNVRELKNALERAAVLGDGTTIRPEDLPERIRALGKKGLSRFPSLEAMEKEHIQAALDKFKGNKKKAAEVLGIARSTLHEKLKKLGIKS